MLNKIIITGNLTKDPELRYTPKGDAVVTLRLASNRKYKDRDETCFVNVVVWGKRAENCNSYLKKGSPVFIEGRLQSRSWEGKDGKKQYAIEIVTEDIRFLDRTKEGTSQEEGEAQDQDWPEGD